MALGWQLLRDLKDRKIGTNEVENDSIRRSWQRSVKNGYKGDKKEFARGLNGKRDKTYIEGMMKLRMEQAREDWRVAKSMYLERKERIRREELEQGRLNAYKKELKKMVEKHNELYLRERERHRDKIDRLEAKHCKGCKAKTPEELEDQKNKWIRRIADG